MFISKETDVETDIITPYEANNIIDVVNLGTIIRLRVKSDDINESVVFMEPRYYWNMMDEINGVD